MPRGAKGRLGAAAVRLADVVVAPSHASAAGFRHGGVEPLVVHYLAPDGVREDRQARADVVVGTLAEISARKGTDVFVQAARLARSRSEVPLRFRLAGAPPSADDAWSRAVVSDAREAGIDVVGSVDARDELARIDLLAMPSRRDPFPLAVLEAMAAGTPVVGAAVDGIAEQLADGAGRLVTPEDPVALAEAIVELAADPESRRQIAERARRRAVEDFTPARQAEGVGAAYEAALARRAQRPGLRR
jgi:glycosyltransferase involved in cell wall biosynthesis